VPVSCNIAGRKLFISFYLTSHLNYPAIIGLPILEKHGAILDCRSKSVTWPDQSSNQSQDESIEKIPASAKIQKKVSWWDGCSSNYTPTRDIQVDLCSWETLHSQAAAESVEIFATIVEDSTSFELCNVSTHRRSEDSSASNLPPWLQDKAEAFDLSKTEVLPPYNPLTAFPIDLTKDLSELRCIPRPYKTTQVEDEALRKAVESGLRSGQISPSMAAFGVPVLFVKKPDGSLRMCFDYRAINAVTKTIVANLPNIDEILSSLPPTSSPRYTKLDLKSAFNLIRIRKGDVFKTAFITKLGKFESNVLPFGLANAPAHFQDVMLRILREFVGKGLFVYIDDILIYEPDPKRHRELVRKVLEVLLKYSFVVNPQKCVFEASTVEFLGYVLSPQGISPIPAKLKSVDLFAQPTTVRQVQAFLGVINFYREFIPNFSTIARPLYDLTMKGKPFVWDATTHTAFQNLKSKLQSAPFLKIPDRSQPFFLYTDASNTALGAVLHQRDSDASERPVAFFSRSLSTAEKNYTVHDKELLAVVEACKHWRHLLLGTKDRVQVFTDHEALAFFTKPQLLNQRQIRWGEVLSGFNLKYTHIPGKKKHYSGRPITSFYTPRYANTPCSCGFISHQSVRSN
jgi:hypothetical protein